MWLLYAVGSSFFAGITAILVKIGVEDTDSHLLTALRTPEFDSGRFLLFCVFRLKTLDFC